MDTTTAIDPFAGAWTMMSIPDLQLDIEFDGNKYSAKLPSFAPLPLDKDEWNNLKGDGVCLSLHRGSGRLFGLYRSPQGNLSTLAATREKIGAPQASHCGEDWDGFGRLVGKDFTIQVMQASMPVPVGPQGLVRLQKTILSTGVPVYQIGTVRNGSFEVFDELCPDRANGTLNSRKTGMYGTLRSVTLWQDPDGKTLGVFSMVAVGAQVFDFLESRSGQDEDLAALGAQLSLLPFEVRGLLVLAKERAEGPAHGPGDPMIVWGADDGGG